jgi:hypothetical protein
MCSWNRKYRVNRGSFCAGRQYGRDSLRNRSRLSAVADGTQFFFLMLSRHFRAGLSQAALRGCSPADFCGTALMGDHLQLHVEQGRINYFRHSRTILHARAGRPRDSWRDPSTRLRPGCRRYGYEPRRRALRKRKPGWLARFLLRRVGCGYITARRDWR